MFRENSSTGNFIKKKSLFFAVHHNETTLTEFFSSLDFVMHLTTSRCDLWKFGSLNLLPPSTECCDRLFILIEENEMTWDWFHVSSIHVVWLLWICFENFCWRSSLASVNRLFNIGETQSCVNEKHFQSNRVSAAGCSTCLAVHGFYFVPSLFYNRSRRNLSKQEAI